MGQPTNVSDFMSWDVDKGIYYVELDWASNFFYGSRSIQFALISDMDSNWTTHWDSSNDYSRQEINNTDYVKSTHIPVYVNNQLYFGTEPEGDISTKTNISGLKNVVVSPNPASSNIEILNAQEVDELSIIDTTGAEVLKEKSNNQNSFQLDISQYRSGVYFLIYKNLKGYKRIEKFIKN